MPCTARRLRRRRHHGSRSGEVYRCRGAFRSPEFPVDVDKQHDAGLDRAGAEADKEHERQQERAPRRRRLCRQACGDRCLNEKGLGRPRTEIEHRRRMSQRVPHGRAHPQLMRPANAPAAGHNARSALAHQDKRWIKVAMRWCLLHEARRAPTLPPLRGACLRTDRSTRARRAAWISDVEHRSTPIATTRRS